MDVFDLIADERRKIADVLAGLTPEQLQTPSLCPPWTVHDVAAHLVGPFQIGLGQALLALATSGFNFDRWAESTTARIARKPTAELVAILRRHAASRWQPPGGGGPEKVLAEVLIHALDIRHPLGIAGSTPGERQRLVLDFLAGTPARGFVKDAWRRGLRFEATDLDWSHGQGPVVRGPADSIMLALTGRIPALDDLQGDGVAVMRRRFAGG